MRPWAAPVRPLTRRSLLRAAACTAPALCALRAAPVAAAARLTVADPTTVVVWNPACSYFQIPYSVELPLINEILAGFYAKHPGIRLQSAGPMINTGNTISAILAGTGPDVFPDNTVAPYVSQNLVLDLAPYMRQDNISPDIFATSQMEKFTTREGKIFMLPSYIGATAYLVNLDIVDQLGLTYPDPDWTWLEWTTFFRQVARKTTRGQLYATTLFDAYTAPSAFYFHGFGASFVDPNDPARCGLDVPGGVQCASWVYELLHDNLAFFADGGQTHTLQVFAQGLLVVPTVWQPMLFRWVPLLRAMKWDFYPLPKWPVQPATFCNSDFWAIKADTKVPEAAWELVKWLTTDGAYSRMLMHLALVPPNLKSLWPEWEYVAQAVAPPLRGKRLGVFGQYILTNYAFPGRDFAYENETARSLLAAGLQQIWSGQVTPELGVRLTAQRVNAFEAAAAAMSQPLPPGIIDQFPQQPH